MYKSSSTRTATSSSVSPSQALPRAMSTLTSNSRLEEFETRLCLGIGGGSQPTQQFDEPFPPPRELDGPGRRHGESPSRNNGSDISSTTNRHRHNKKARIRGQESYCQSASDGEDTGGARKKLRLTVEQATMLEDSFRAHNILSPSEKQDLARQLRLSPRQVEVWFQNRRARTKMKKTEVDHQLLQRWCQRLSQENARLRRELAEVRSSAVSKLTAAAMVNTFCPACDKLNSDQIEV